MYVIVHRFYNQSACNNGVVVFDVEDDLQPLLEKIRSCIAKWSKKNPGQIWLRYCDDDLSMFSKEEQEIIRFLAMVDPYDDGFRYRYRCSSLLESNVCIQTQYVCFTIVIP